MPTTKQREFPVIYVAGSARELPAEVQDWLAQAENRALASPHVYDLLAQLARGKKFAAIIVNIQSVDWNEMDFFEHAVRLSRHTPIYVAGPHQQRAKLEVACRRGARLFDAIALTEEAAQVELPLMPSPAPAEPVVDEGWQHRARMTVIEQEADRLGPPVAFSHVPSRSRITEPTGCVEVPPRSEPQAERPSAADLNAPTIDGDGDGHFEHGLAAATDVSCGGIQIEPAAATVVADSGLSSIYSPESQTIAQDSARPTPVPVMTEPPAVVEPIGAAQPAQLVERPVAMPEGGVQGFVEPAGGADSAVASARTETIAPMPAPSPSPAAPQPVEQMPIQPTPDVQPEARPAFRLAPTEIEDDPRIVFPWSTYASRPRRIPPRTVDASSPPSTGYGSGPVSPSAAADPPLNVRLTPEEIAALMGKASTRDPNAEAQS